MTRGLASTLVGRNLQVETLKGVVSSIAHSRKHPVTALYIVPPEAVSGDDETLRTLRSAVEMLVVVSDESYVPAMIAALGPGANE